MKRFLGVWVIWFVLLLAIFTCALVSQSDAIEALEKRIDALEDKSSSDSIEKE